MRVVTPPAVRSSETVLASLDMAAVLDIGRECFDKLRVYNRGRGCASWAVKTLHTAYLRTAPDNFVVHRS